ncbi:MAG: transcriptional repressor [Candidatus Saccharibacteria bacterium]|nr:transcriptional repressor [Moraxellaceae bacterium]
MNKYTPIISTHDATHCQYTHHQHDHSIANHSHENCVHDTHTHSIAKRIADAELECQRRGVRWTALRSDVLTLILQAAQPVGAYDLLAKMAHQGRPPAPPTVYRSLDFLLEQGFIHRLTSINAFVPCCHPRYGHQAAFLICTRCHRVDEAESHDLQHVLESLAKQGGFLPQQTTIEVAGLCVSCQKTEFAENAASTQSDTPRSKETTLKKPRKTKVQL